MKVQPMPVSCMLSATPALRHFDYTIGVLAAVEAAAQGFPPVGSGKNLEQLQERITALQEYYKEARDFLGDCWYSRFGARGIRALAIPVGWPPSYSPRHTGMPIDDAVRISGYISKLQKLAIDYIDAFPLGEVRANASGFLKCK
eukprot:365417-Chlamydomonas_euryale.AAC.19